MLVFYHLVHQSRLVAGAHVDEQSGRREAVSVELSQCSPPKASPCIVGTFSSSRHVFPQLLCASPVRNRVVLGLCMVEVEVDARRARTCVSGRVSGRGSQKRGAGWRGPRVPLIGCGETAYFERAFILRRLRLRRRIRFFLHLARI